MRVRIVLLAAIAVCRAAGAASAQAPPAAALSFEGAVERALQVNPALEAARRRQLVSVQAVAVARARPNPDARVEFTRETPTQAYTLAVPLETGGKRGRRTAVGQAGVSVSDAEVARAAVDLRVAVRRAYFDLAAAESRLALLQEMHDLAARARDAAQQRFDAGDAPRLEVLQGELARAEAENQVTAAHGAVEAGRAQLRALLALPADATLSLATAVDAGIAGVPRPSGAGVDPAHVDLAVLDRELDQQRARIALATAMRVPDLTPEATVTRGAEPEFTTGWRVGLGVTVPIFARNRVGVRLEEATLGAMAAERAATLSRIAGDIAAAGAVADALGQQYLRYRAAIVPQAIEIERLAEDAYRLGRTGIAAFLQALQTSRDMRLRMLQTAADFQAALATLERAFGAPLP